MKQMRENNAEHIKKLKRHCIMKKWKCDKVGEVAEDKEEEETKEGDDGEEKMQE